MERQDLCNEPNYLKHFRLLLALICMTFCLSSAMPDAVNAATVRLNVTKRTICQKKTLKLKVQGTKKKVKWKSSKTAVATVSSNGKVTAKKTGSAVITARVENKTYKCKVTVKKHSYRKATCTAAKECTRCGAVSGKALGHDYREATCTQPQTCSRCGRTSGKALGHDYQEATCTQPRTCSRCHATTGGVLGHDYKEATCTQPETCTRCNATYGEPLGHDYREATCTQPQTCNRCSETSGVPLGHQYSDTVVPATKKGKGYTLHECSRCHDTYKDCYTDFQPNPQQVYQDMVALRTKYPEGMRWTNDNDYSSPYLGHGYGCAGFAFALSDEAFGYLPARNHTDFADLKVGDILRVNGDTHSVVILEITPYGVILAEGNINSSIHWGRTMTFNEIQRNGTYVTTRYPK